MSKKAVYWRVYSGELLDRRSLRRALVKAVRRSIGESGLARPRMKLGILIPDVSPVAGLVLFDVISYVEKEYGSEIVPIISNKTEFRKNFNNNILKYKIPQNLDPEDPIACWRAERALALKHARSAGIDLLLIPLTKTDANLLMIEVLLRGEPQAISEASPKIDWTTPPIASGLIRAEGELVAAYAAAFGEEAWRGYCKARLRDARELYYSIAVGRPELEFSSHKSLHLLLRGTTHMGKCPVCGGFTDSGGVCHYCRRIFKDNNY